MTEGETNNCVTDLTSVIEGRLPADLKIFPLLRNPIVYCFIMGDLDIQIVHLDKFTPI